MSVAAIRKTLQYQPNGCRSGGAVYAQSSIAGNLPQIHKSLYTLHALRPSHIARIAIHSIAFHYCAFHLIAFHYCAFHFTIAHCISLLRIAMHRISLLHTSREYGTAVMFHIGEIMWPCSERRVADSSGGHMFNGGLAFCDG